MTFAPLLDEQACIVLEIRHAAMPLLTESIHPIDVHRMMLSNDAAARTAILDEMVYDSPPDKLAALHQLIVGKLHPASVNLSPQMQSFRGPLSRTCMQRPQSH